MTTVSATASSTRDDAAFMDRALELARARLGKVAPNPAVGCVIVRDGEIVGQGATADGGRPHAEEIALEEAGELARGAVAYISLEPCAVRSSGEDACADLFVAAGVKRVVAACDDPHPFADGDGLARLRAAGVEVKVGVRRREGEAVNAGFFLVVREGRPFVAVDDDDDAYDAKLSLNLDKELLEQLRALANQGFTRVNAEPDTELADALRTAGLVDYEPE